MRMTLKYKESNFPQWPKGELGKKDKNKVISLVSK